MNRYPPAPSEPPRIDRRRIPSGLEGARTTAAHIGRLIRDGAGDFYVRQKAIDILMERGVPAKDYLGEIDALFRWVQRHVRYTKDPFRIEVLHSARRMLELKAGDCDDMAIVLGALIKSVGHPVRIVLTGPDPLRPDLFSHIYLEARHHDQWIPLDATMPYGMGWSPRSPVRQVLSIEEEHSDARTATSTTNRSASASAASAPSRAGADADADANASAHARSSLAARSTARHSRGGRPTERSPREGVVAPAPPAPAAGAQSVGALTPAIHLAEGPQRPAAAEHDRSFAGIAQESRPPDRQPAAPTVVGTKSSDGAPGDASSAAGGGPSRRNAAAGGPPAAGASSRIATSRPIDAAVRSAATLYQRFTRMPARSIERVAHARLMPPVVLEIGRLAGLVYRSSKWVGRPRTYIHFMDDPPRLVSDVTGRRLFIVGGSYRVTPRGIEG
jgi:Transglutaminase-like superfamily